MRWNQFTTPKIDSFSGWVKKIGPEKVESKKMVTRIIIIKLTTAITRT